MIRHNKTILFPTTFFSWSQLAMAFFDITGARWYNHLPRWNGSKQYWASSS